MNFKFSTNFFMSHLRKPAKYGGHGSTGLDATPIVQIHICHPVIGTRNQDDICFYLVCYGHKIYPCHSRVVLLFKK